MATREFTGKHAAAIFVGAFGIIISVNVLLAVSAVRTFPGLEVKNSYIASQEFDAKRNAQLALGWSVFAEVREDQLILSISDRDGRPVQPKTLNATLGRATHVKDDLTPDFFFNGSAYVASVDLAPGNWNIRMTALAADGTEFSQRVILHVKG